MSAVMCQFRRQSGANPSPNCKFPGNRGKNREFNRFPGPQTRVNPQKSASNQTLALRVPNHRTGNFLKSNREFDLATDHRADTGLLGRSLRSLHSSTQKFFHPRRLVSAEFRRFFDEDPSQVAGSPETWRQKVRKSRPYRSKGHGSTGHGQGSACRTRMGGQKMGGWR